MKKKFSQKQVDAGVFVKMFTGSEEIINLKLNDFQNPDQVNETLNGMIRILSAAIIGSALAMMTEQNTDDIRVLPLIVDKLFDKFSDDTKEFLMDSIKQTIENRIAKKSSKEYGGKA